jgi:uncharacterized protein YdhG (YjbR/CyaY superfamily)
VSLYPHPNAVKAFQDRLTDFKTSSSTIQFPLDKPLPADLIYEIATFRVWESKEKGIKWM